MKRMPFTEGFSMTTPSTGDRSVMAIARRASCCSLVHLLLRNIPVAQPLQAVLARLFMFAWISGPASLTPSRPLRAMTYSCCAVTQVGL